MHKFCLDRLGEHIDVIKGISADAELITMINDTAKVMVQTYRSGCKLLICGNGGSAADSQHIATELVSRFLIERKALDAEALTVNTSSLTAIGNDYSFDKVFSRQVEAKGKKGDVLIGITTSGNSRNVIEAIETAKTIGMKGNNKNSTICKISDCCLSVPSGITPRIQEAHILIGHILCEFVENEIFGENK